ncbi:hypothetical protein STEG23_015196, partial [Scotinomys teguina]
EMSDKRQHHRVLKHKLRPLEEEAMGPSPKEGYTVDIPYKSLRATAEVTARGTAQVEMMEDDSKSPTVYLQKSDEKELEPVAGGAILPSPQGSLPGRSLHREDGDNITVAGASASLGHSASSAIAPATPAWSTSHHVPPVNTDVNHKIKSALTTEIGCFEQQYGRIFKLLQEVQGPLEVQLHFVKFAIKEAARNPAGFHTFQREMSDKRQHHRVLKQKLRPLEEEAMGPSPKKRYTEEMVPYKSLRATAEVTARGTAQVEMMEDDSKSPTVYLQKSDEKELEPVAGGAILPSPQGSLPGHSLHREDGDNITVAGASVSLGHSSSTANAPATPARSTSHHVPPVNTDVNHKIKSALTTEIGCFEQCTLIDIPNNSVRFENISHP